MGLIITGEVPLQGGATQTNAYARIRSFAGNNETDGDISIVYLSWYTSYQARLDNINNRLPVIGELTSVCIPTQDVLGGTGKVAAIVGYEFVKNHLQSVSPQLNIADD